MIIITEKAFIEIEQQNEQLFDKSKQISRMFSMIIVPLKFQFHLSQKS
jgi:hypothetical protein